MTRTPLLCVLFGSLLFASLSVGQVGQHGIRGKEAPPWGVTNWINLPEGKQTLDIGDYRGKVLYLYGFQAHCPGCHSHGFPLLQSLLEEFGEADDVAFVAIQTAFEGFGHNTPEAAWQTADRYDLTIPVGHSGFANKRSALMQTYRTGGTPWSIIIDKQGIVRFDGFFVTEAKAKSVIENLRSRDSEK